MTQAKHADQFVSGKAFPGPAVPPGKTSGFDRGRSEALLSTGLNLLAQPAQVIEFLCQRSMGGFADDNTGDLGKIRAQRVDMTVPFDQDLDVDRQQASANKFSA